MLNLDKYIYQDMEIQLFGEVVHIQQPTVGMYMEIRQIESDMTRENFWDKRVQVAALILNHNKEKRKFKTDEIRQMTRTAIEALVIKVMEIKKEADDDPN